MSERSEKSLYAGPHGHEPPEQATAGPANLHPGPGLAPAVPTGPATSATNPATARQTLVAHGLAAKLQNTAAWRVFMTHHVFAVWDFMSLAKRLQQEVTCTTLPWMPVAQPRYARLINEIVLEEESDTDDGGGFSSHFDRYRQAMDACGADRRPIDGFIAALQSQTPLAQALQAHAPGPAVVRFVTDTIDVACHAPPHVVAGVFFYGREDIIPTMFSALTACVQQGGSQLAPLGAYLKRHIDLDGDSHGPLAAELLTHLCAGNPRRLPEAHAAAAQALKRRADLWTGIEQALTHPLPS